MPQFETLKMEYTPIGALINGATPVNADTEKERILVVDDSRTVRKTFCSYLSSKFECSEAGSFDEALLELKANEFAVVITDVIMPGMSGIELLRKVREEFPDTAVIVVSGVDRPQRALDAIRSGAFDYLIKPCEPEVLQITVERALERRELIRNAGLHKLQLETSNLELLSRQAQLESLQTQMVHNAKMASLGQLAAGVAHELNNPVGFVHANLEILGEYLQDVIELLDFYDDLQLSAENSAEIAEKKAKIRYPTILSDIQSIVQDCREGSNRIRDISQNLRTFSRLDEAEFKETDIHEGLEATIRMASQYFTSDNIVLIRQYADLPRIGAFSGQLNQVWMNLLVNAAQAIAPGKGEVSITTRYDADNIYVEIGDTGCGIAVQNMDRIFDPFYTTKPVGEGTGLGLSISFSIVERHGGSISVKTTLGSGTIFTVRLPIGFKPAIHMEEKSIACYTH